MQYPEHKTSSPNYNFIDHIRCISMMTVIFEHGFGSHDLPLHATKFWIYISFIQAAKFGTVIFFMIAGFLISEKFTDYTPGQYVKRRFSNTFGPWLFWSVVFIVFNIVAQYVPGTIFKNDNFRLEHILKGIKYTYCYTTYWFIVNFMVSIMVLLVFKRHLYSLALGACLLVCTLFYSINIYFEWFDPRHSTALLGFVFFLWLGAQMRKYWLAITQWINKISYYWLILAALLTYGLAICEMLILIHRNSGDPYNTLRISNLIFSVVVFALLIKINNIPVLNYLKPRQTTYGLYLIHFIITVFVLNAILQLFNINEEFLSPLQFTLLRISEFLIVYVITLVIVMVINKTPARKLIGS